MFSRSLASARKIKLATLAVLTLFFSAVFVFSVSAQEAAKADASKAPKYVFLMIGDGMGVNQRLAAEKCLPDGKKLIMDSFPNSALTTTNSTVAVTDSAAAGTALACGVKTNNGVLGLDKDGKRVESIAELLKKKGFKIGIMTNVPLNHATPAAFYAHSSGRGSYSEISAFVPESKFELFVGADFLVSKNEQKPDAMLKEKGYNVLNDADAFRKFQKGAGGLIFTYKIASEPTSADPKKITLAECLSKATELLDCDKGFFIMLEGGEIDWASHANDLAPAIREVFAFDDAVKVANEFYLKHPAETLIVVTADHETGGLVLSESSKPLIILNSQKISKGEIIKELEKAKKEKASVDAILKIAQDSFGLKELSEAEIKSIKEACDAFMGNSLEDGRATEIKKMYGSKNPVAEACSKILLEKAGVKWTAGGGHSGGKVKTTAIGAGSELFNGEIDNTDVPAKIKKAMGVE